MSYSAVHTAPIVALRGSYALVGHPERGDGGGDDRIRTGDRGFAVLHPKREGA